MNSILKLNRESISKDGLTRTCDWTYDQPLYNKTITFQIPNYCTPITISPKINMLAIRIRLEHIVKKHSKLYTLKFFDVDSHLLDKIENNQTDLFGKYIYEKTKMFFKNNLMILDPASDSLYFKKSLKKISECKKLPKEVKELAAKLHELKIRAKEEKTKNISNPLNYSKVRDKLLKEFWEKILENRSNLLDFEKKIHQQGILSYGDIVLPFTKLIRTKQDVKDVERINSAWMHWNVIEEKPKIAYIPINNSTLKHVSIIDDICDYIARLKSDVLVVKIKEIMLTDPSRNSIQRESLGKILSTITKKKQQNEELLTICLECSDHIWPFPIQSFDVVSAAPNLFEKESEFGHVSMEGYGGKMIDEHTLGLISFDECKKEFDRAKIFPCTHEYCRNHITTMDKSQYDKYAWYVDLRIHNILTMTNWTKMIANSVHDGTAGLAADRIKSSPYGILVELLTKNYGDQISDLI